MIKDAEDFAEEDKKVAGIGEFNSGGQKWSDVVRSGLQRSKRILFGHILTIKRSLTDPRRSKNTKKVLLCIFSTYFVLI